MHTYSPEFMEFLKVVANEDVLIIDTETTGLERGEIVQIAACKLDGTPYYQAFVKPVNGIPLDAQRIHGISNEKVAGAYDWRVIRKDLIEMIRGKFVVIYNAVYDRKMMHQSDEAWSLPHYDYKAIAPFHCAMLAYAEFWGDWNDYRQSYKWQRLSVAAENCGVVVQGAHDAMGDCIMTAGVVRHMLAVAPTSDRFPDADIEQNLMEG